MQLIRIIFRSKVCFQTYPILNKHHLFSMNNIIHYIPLVLVAIFLYKITCWITKFDSIKLLVSQILRMVEMFCWTLIIKRFKILKTSIMINVQWIFIVLAPTCHRGYAWQNKTFYTIINTGNYNYSKIVIFRINVI